MVRVFSLKEEKNWGVDAGTPDWTMQLDSGSASLNADPLTDTGGSRMIKQVRGGMTKPSASTENKIDVKRVGHFFKAFLGAYKFTKGTEATETTPAKNIHEFYGDERKLLPSFTADMLFDDEQKRIVGMQLDTLKLEAKDKFLTMNGDWIYKTESAKGISEGAYIEKEIVSIPFATFDTTVQLGNGVQTSVITEFTYEGKNNLDQDATFGLGSRFAQRAALAKTRDTKMTLKTELSAENLALVLGAEYGKIPKDLTNFISPSLCENVSIPLTITMKACDDPDESVTIAFPDCVMNVDYKTSAADNIDVTFTLNATGTKNITLNDTTTKLTTDIYVKILNDQPEITAA